MNKIYTVRPGDTLTGIARASNSGTAAVLALNPQISNPNLILPGQQIVLPDAVDRSDMLRTLARETYAGDEPEWFKIAAREEQAGVSEYERGSNPRIVEYLATCRGLDRAQTKDDGTAWCSAFVNWCFKVCKLSGSGSARALSWEAWGGDEPNPSVGSVVVWRRSEDRGGKRRLLGGHVALLVEDRGDRLFVLGGNQGNRVCRKSYPRDGYVSDTVVGGERVRHHYELVAFRRP